MTQDEFRAKIFDYNAQTEWTYNGTECVVIDCYYSWCGPCKRLAPIMEELAADYKGQVRFYKMDMQVESDMARAFGISSCPTVILIPNDKSSKPYAVKGLRPKEEWVEYINKALLGK